MNERILKLVAEARQYAWENETHWSANLERDKLFEQKFAELIVRECIKKCKDHPSIIFKNEWDADVVAPDIVSRLESHFGVEE